MTLSWGYAFVLRSSTDNEILLTELLSRVRRRVHYSPRDSLIAESYAIPRTPTVLTSGIIYPTKLNHLRREPVRVTLECGWHPLVAQPYPCHLSLVFFFLLYVRCSLTCYETWFSTVIYFPSRGESRAREKARHRRSTLLFDGMRRIKLEIFQAAPILLKAGCPRTIALPGLRI